MKYTSLFVTLLGLLSGCQSLPTTSVSQQAEPSASIQRPTEYSAWVKHELYFATGPYDSTEGISEAEWKTFLDDEVTSRFPDGLTVVDSYGQWLSEGSVTPSALRSKIVIILHPNEPLYFEKMNQIRDAWKKMTNHVSVLSVVLPAEVSF